MNGPSFLTQWRKQDKEQKWGLVLAGGGTKGAYEVGAWKAICELRLPIRGIAGTSIGALNAAMFLGCGLKHTEEIYENISISDVLPVSGSIDPSKDVFDPANLLALAREYITQRGLDNSPLRNMLETHLDIDKIYESPIDLGIVTYNIRTREPLQIFKDDIERDKLIEYLLASANFPIYKSLNVDGKHFMDGGLYDNMPFNALIERGYNHLIVLDISGVGLTRKVENVDNVYIKLISTSEDLGGTFEFNHERMDKNITLGYLDTLKAFHRLFGNYYFFRRPAFNDLLMAFDLKTINGLETVAKLLGVDRYRIYKADEFIEELVTRYTESDRKFSEKFTDGLRRMDLIEMRRLVSAEVGIPALVHSFMEQPTNRNSSTAKAFPDLAEAANAIIELKNYRKM